MPDILEALKQEEQVWVGDTLKKIEEKMAHVSVRSAKKIPYTTVNGIHDDRSGDDNICWWTNGFWGGIMWQLYRLTGQESYRKAALLVEEKLDKNLMNYEGLDHDNGFKWLPTSVIRCRLEKNPESKNRGLLAAGAMAGRYNPAGRFIRAWNDWGEDDHRGVAIIDCMMNLPLLYWAFEETKDSRFYQIAVNHADTAMAHFVRGDGSVVHIVEFHPDTGEFLRTQGGQGYEVGSSWTRGQAWGLYGFVISYLHTKKEAYLETAKRIANYFIANIPENGLIPVDFRQPGECVWEDSTAAAIAACGLIELAKLEEGRNRQQYMKPALKLLKALEENRCNWDPECDELLEKCTAAYHDKEHEFSIIYGDYYFIEAMMKLEGRDLFIW